MRTRTLGNGGPEISVVGFDAWAITAIVGARTSWQVEENVKAGEVELSADDMKEIDDSLRENA